MKRWLSPIIGTALLAALATPPAAHAQGSTKSYEDITRGAAELRKLAARAWLPSNFDQEMKAEYTKQTTWLKNAAGRCDALAKKMQAAGSKARADKEVRGKDAAQPSAEWPNLRNALQKENGDFSFKSPDAKARQQEANNIFQALQ